MSQYATFELDMRIGKRVEPKNKGWSGCLYPEVCTLYKCKLRNKYYEAYGQYHELDRLGKLTSDTLKEGIQYLEYLSSNIEDCCNKKIELGGHPLV